MSKITDEAARHNRLAWDSFRRQRDEGLVPIRTDSAQASLEGNTRLEPDNLKLVGEISGKRLLDLGCGDGAEMLAWARLGALVTGVDNSPTQLEAARRNAERLAIDCRLVLADLLHLPEDLLQAQFDIVFSASVTAWIGNLDQWFRNVFLALKPGGLFLLNAYHPLAGYFHKVVNGSVDKDSYFSEGPFQYTLDHTDFWNPAGDSITTVEWSYTLGTILTAIGQAGLRLTQFLEPDHGEEILNRTGWPGMMIVCATKDR